jgi:hypothetical protein
VMVYIVCWTLQSQACLICSIASVVKVVARAHVDDDSVENDLASVHIDWDGMVTSIQIDHNGTINSISRFFSSYSDCQPVSLKNRFCLDNGKSSTDYMTASSAHGLGISLACTDQSILYASALCGEYGDGIDIRSDLRNWMPDTGLSSHFTPCLLDLKEVEEGLDLGCVPGLKKRIFSVSAFVSRGHYAIVRKNEIQLMFEQEERPLTLMLKNGLPVANNATVKKFTTVLEDVKQQSHAEEDIDLELAHVRFVRPSRDFLAASSAGVWNDLTIKMSPDFDCISCRIFTIKATARIQHQSTPVTKLVQDIYVDILPTVSAESLTPKSNFPALLILVDAFSRFIRIIGMPSKSSQSVIVLALSTFAAEHRMIRGLTIWDIEKIKSDAGIKFTS